MNDHQGEGQPSGIEITKSEGIDWGKVWHATGVGVALLVGASVAWAANYHFDTNVSLILGGTAMAMTEAAFLTVAAMATKEKKPTVTAIEAPPQPDTLNQPMNVSHAPGAGVNKTPWIYRPK